MSKLSISKELIVSIAEQENIKYIKNISKKLNMILSSALKKMSEKISYVNLDNIILQPINELMSGALVDNSDFIYFLGIKNAQLEMNTARKIPLWQNIVNRFKFAWENRKSSKRKKRKKLFRRKKEAKTINLSDYKFDPSKYNIYNLTEDLQNAIIEYLSASSIVYLNGNLLQIIGKEDFGSNVQILIYLVSYDGNKFKYYAGKKLGYKEIDVQNRYNILQEKINNIGDNFLKIIKILNSLYYNVNRYIPNQVFIESIVASCPEDFFIGDDIYKIFLKIINYFTIKTLKNVKSINDPSKTIHQDDVCGNCMFGFNKMLNMINK